MKFFLAALFLFTYFLTEVRSDYNYLHWNDCGSDPSLQILDLAVSPMPFLVPGNMSFTMRVAAPHGHHLDRMILSLETKRRTSWIDLPVPCLFNIGSCVYDDTCTLLERMQTENWAGVMRNIGGQIKTMLDSAGLTEHCDTDIDEINIQNYVLKMPSLPSVLVFFAEGDYETKLQAIDHRTNNVLICVEMRMTMKLQRETCNDWFCRLQRRLSITT